MITINENENYGYFNGDRVELTGNTENVYGETFFEFIFTEGHRTGETILNTVRNENGEGREVN